MSRFLDQSVFLAAAETAFAFLLEEGGFVQWDSGERGLVLVGEGLTVCIAYDGRTGRVVTVIEGGVGRRNPRANLTCLYVAAGLGPAQAIRGIARTRKDLSPVVETHALALQRLLPRLRSDAGAKLLIDCNGT